MALVRIKRKILSAEGTVKVIRQIENGKKKDDVCQEFGLINDPNDLKITKQNKITSIFDHKVSRIKQFQMPEHSDIDEALLQVAEARMK
jgi:hypothetical protein